MRLYAGSSVDFIYDSVHNVIADRLKGAFEQQYRFTPAPSEVASWRNSLRAMSGAIEIAGLKDHGVILEYQLPLTSKRLDCMITGHDAAGAANAVIVELKQWETCSEAPGDNEVVSFVGGQEREILHPSVQVGRYLDYMRDFHTAFYEGADAIRATACAFLHNYSYVPDDALTAPKFGDMIKAHPLFVGEEIDDLGGFLTHRLSHGRGMEVLERIESSPYRPSRSLLAHVAQMIKGVPIYTLLDEQLVVFDKVMSLVRPHSRAPGKTIVIVRGGPGTGKSVIAINLLAELSRLGLNTHYATGSQAFTETLRKTVGSRAAAQFKYFNSYMNAPEGVMDVLVADEAHRLRTVSANRYTRKADRTDKPQLDELFRAANVGVYFIDDRQVVRRGEIGSVGYIKARAASQGCRVIEYELEAQFRCLGSDGFVNWIDNTLQIRRTANTLWDKTEKFDFQIFDSPVALDNAIRAKAAAGHSARLTAGYCWPWSKPDAKGQLADDVVLGEFRRPWNARSDAARLAPGIPKSHFWATVPAGLEQVGCVYTAQGFEFEYVGVIFGPDLVWDPVAAAWTGVPSANCDRSVKGTKEGFIDFVKNTYRVLLSRGMKGCYVYFVDEGTRNFFRSRME